MLEAACRRELAAAAAALEAPHGLADIVLVALMVVPLHLDLAAEELSEQMVNLLVEADTDSIPFYWDPRISAFQKIDSVVDHTVDLDPLGASCGDRLAAAGDTDLEDAAAVVAAGTALASPAVLAEIEAMRLVEADFPLFQTADHTVLVEVEASCLAVRDFLLFQTACPKQVYVVALLAVEGFPIQVGTAVAKAALPTVDSSSENSSFPDRLATSRRLYYYFALRLLLCRLLLRNQNQRILQRNQ